MNIAKYKLLRSILFLLTTGLFVVPGTEATPIVYVYDQGFALQDIAGEASEISISGSDSSLQFSVKQNGVVSWNWSQTPFGFYQTVISESSFNLLDAGAQIDGMNDWFAVQRDVFQLASMSGDGPAFDTQGFLGIRVFEQEFDWEEEDALPYYGWIRIEHSAADATLTVHDWAWNSTPGEPILAGQIPEPATYAILVALGALGFAIVRRRCRSGRLPIA